MSDGDSFFPETIPSGDVFSATVVGCHFYGDVRDFHVGQRLRLLREPGNPHDANAIAVHAFKDRQVGHLQRETADWFARELDRGIQAVVTVTAIDPGTGDATHGKTDHRPPRIYVRIERLAAPLAAMELPDGKTQSPPNPEPKKTSQSCFVVTAACGSEHDPLVCFYRDWRDQTLRPNPCGPFLIWLYSRCGPLGAGVLNHFPRLKYPVRRLLVWISRLL